jgi:hypothetical protein
VSFVEQTGTAGDFLRERREEYAPITEGQIDAEQIAIEAKRRGRTPTRTDEKGIKAREATARSRERAKSKEGAPPKLKAGRPPKQSLGGQKTIENFMGSGVAGI